MIFLHCKKAPMGQWYESLKNFLPSFVSRAPGLNFFVKVFSQIQRTVYRKASGRDRARIIKQ
jgi:hypothetical protein